MKKSCRHYSTHLGNDPLDSIPTSNTAPPAIKKKLPGIHRIRMKRVTMLSLILSAGVIIVCLSGCSNDYSLEDVERITDQALLAKIAMEDEDSRVRRAAVEKLTDQAALAAVALGDTDSDVREVAVGELTDQANLAKVAIEAGYGTIRQAAVAKLTDQAVLAKVALEDEDWEVREKAVAKLTDQSLLAKVAIEAGDGTVRDAAVEKLTCQATLAKVALEDEVWGVRLAAARKLADQNLLAKVATETVDDTVRDVAVEKLTDLSLLAKLAYGDDLVRVVVIEKLLALASQKKAARESKDWKIRLFFNQVIPALSSVPKEHRVRLMADVLPALRVLSNPAIVSEIGEIVDIKTYWKSTSASYFGTLIGKKPGEWFSCSIGVGNLPNPLSYTWLTDFPSTTNNLEFKYADVDTVDLLEMAFERLSKTLLVKLALEDEDSIAREAAVRNIADQDQLAKIADEDKDWGVRQAAKKRLDELRNEGR